MSTIRTLIVDDEPLAREGIRVLLRRHAGFEVVAECASGSEAIASLEALNPDLVFLDVQMPGISGLQALQRARPKRAPVVVFVTAYDQYALQAFEHHALDYLLKPFDDERFDRALERARLQLQQQAAHELSRRMAALVQDGNGSSSQPSVSLPTESAPPRFLERLSVRSGGRVHFFRTGEIDWIEAADYYVKLHVGGKAYLLRESMSHLEEQLDPTVFARIHRSTIVNVNRVRELRQRPQGDSLVLLADGTPLRLSRRRKSQLARKLG